MLALDYSILAYIRVYYSVLQYIMEAQSLLEVLRRPREALELQLPTGQPKAKAKEEGQKRWEPSCFRVEKSEASSQALRNGNDLTFS